MKATVEEFRNTRQKLHSLWDTDPDFIEMVQSYFNGFVMILTPKPPEKVNQEQNSGNGFDKSYRAKSDSSSSNQWVPVAFRNPKPEELENNDPCLYGMLAFRKPYWDREYNFLEMMIELAGIKDNNGNPALGGFQDFTGFTGISGNFYEKYQDGDFREQIEKNHEAIRSILLKYGISTANICLICTKVLDGSQRNDFQS